MRIWHKGKLVAALFVAAFILAMQPAAAETQLKVIVFPGVQNLPIFAAQAKGFLKKRDLAIDLINTPTSGELREGLAAGKYNIAHGGVDNAVAMAEVAKADVAVVMGGDNGGLHLYVQPDIKSIADLRGKTVLVDAPNTSLAFVLYRMLEQGGLKKGDYEIKPVGATNRRLEEMLKDKSASASILFAPHSLRGEKAGLKDMGQAQKVIGRYQATAAYAMRDWSKTNADVLVRYLQAYIEGLRWTLDPANKAEAIKMLAERLKLPEDIAAASYATVPGMLAVDARIDNEGFANVLKLRAEIQGGTPASPDKYIDASYYQRALKGL